MEYNLAVFHDDVEKAFSRWRRSRPLPMPEKGAIIPLSLVIPVVVDAVCDGFLIGIATAITPKGGLILGLANCFEMGFLGIALSLRIAKCTGSSAVAQFAALIAPPLSMLAMAGVGGYIGEASEEHPLAYVGFVSFGIVALLALVCNELLIEASHAEGEDGKWWISVMTFAGIYFVIFLDHVTQVLTAEPHRHLHLGA